MLRRLTAVQLVELRIAKVADVAAAFGVDTATLWRWRQEFSACGVAGLIPDKRGPKGPSRLTAGVVADIRARREGGASLRAIAAAAGVSTGSVRRALAPPARVPDQGGATAGVLLTETNQVREDVGVAVGAEAGTARAAELPVLPAPSPRTGERTAARGP